MQGKLRQSIREELGKLKSMTGRDRIWYLWEYYKAAALLFALSVFVLAVIGNILYRQTFHEQFFCLIINSGSPEAGQELAEGFHEKMGYGRKQTVTVDSTIRIDWENENAPDSYASLTKLAALFVGEDLDVVIADPQTIRQYGESGAWADLSQILPQDLQEQYRDSFLYAVSEDGRDYPCALSLSGIPDSKNRGLPKDAPLFAIKSMSRRSETSIAFLRYLADPGQP